MPEEQAKRETSFLVFTYDEYDFLSYKKFMSSTSVAARKTNLKTWVNPWGSAEILNSEPSSWFSLYRPETWQMQMEGRRVPSACPNAPQILAAAHQWIDVTIVRGTERVLRRTPLVVRPPKLSICQKEKRTLALDMLSLVLSKEIPQALSYTPRRNRALLQISKVEGEYDTTSPGK